MHTVVSLQAGLSLLTLVVLVATTNRMFSRVSCAAHPETPPSQRFAYTPASIRMGLSAANPKTRPARKKLDKGVLAYYAEGTGVDLPSYNTAGDLGKAFRARDVARKHGWVNDDDGTSQKNKSNTAFSNPTGENPLGQLLVSTFHSFR
jgi:hypothetical protein